MSNTPHDERGIRILFDEEWQVVKLDEHRFYSRLSGRGFKGVDFVALHKDYGVALIEFKNYADPPVAVPSDLDLVMIEKQEDTIRLIKIINKYYWRKWHIRLAVRYDWKWMMSNESKLWLSLHDQISSGNYFFIGVVDE